MTNCHTANVNIPGLVIRTADHNDLEQLSDLERLVFGRLSYPYFVLRQLLDVHRDHWLVADRDATICGYALAAPSADGHSAWLLGLGVRPDHRGLGLGSALLARSLDLLRMTPVHQVRLTVEPGHASLTELYSSAGFCAEVTIRDYLGPGEDRVVMVAHLERNTEHDTV